MEGGGEVSDTPRTDFEESMQTQRFGVYMVKADFARTLERENAAMREAIRDSDASLRKCLNYMLRLPLSGSDAECEAMDDAHHALSKLQPFLKP